MPADVSDAPSWVADEGVLVALRFGEAPYLNRTVVTSSQQAARSAWLSGDGSLGNAWAADGVYAPFALIGNRTRHDFCPVPTKLCVSPAFASLSASASVGGNHSTVANHTLNVTLSGAEAWGCDADALAFTCRFTPDDGGGGASNPASATVDAPASLLPATGGGPGPASGVVCAVPVELLEVGAYALTLWYEVVTSSSARALEPTGRSQVPLDDVITFTATNGTDAAADTCSDGEGTQPFLRLLPSSLCLLFPPQLPPSS